MSTELNEFQRLLSNDVNARKAFIQFGARLFRKVAMIELTYWQGERNDNPFNDVDQDNVRELSKKPYIMFNDLIETIVHRSFITLKMMLQCCENNEEIKPFIKTLILQQSINIVDNNQQSSIVVINDAFCNKSNLQTALNWYKHEIFHECIDVFEGFAKERERLYELLNMED